MSTGHNQPVKLVGDDGGLTAAGEELLASFSSENPDPAQLIPVLVEAEWMAEGGVYGTTDDVLPAYLRRDTRDGSVYLWNGFVSPLFTRPVAERLIQFQADLVARLGDEDHESMRWDGDEIVVGVAGVYRDETPEEVRETSYGPSVFNGVPLWPVGDGWVWTDAGETLSLDPFHAWLRDRVESGQPKVSPVGNPALLESFKVEADRRED